MCNNRQIIEQTICAASGQEYWLAAELQNVEMSAVNNSLSQDSNHPDLIISNQDFNSSAVMPSSDPYYV